jgi:hypothetical protein
MVCRSMVLFAFLAMARGAGAPLSWGVVFFPAFMLTLWALLWLYLQKGGGYWAAAGCAIGFLAFLFMILFSGKESDPTKAGAFTSYQPVFVSVQVQVSRSYVGWPACLP